MTTEHEIRSLFDPKYQELLEYKKEIRSYQGDYLLDKKSLIPLIILTTNCVVIFHLISNFWYVGILVALVIHVFLIPELVFRSMVRDKAKKLYK